uniref:class I SAM-dependent methyltransferase n=1 Tax=Allosalinactinospora lopnorensis TaxID=1352348 RepID=UPI0006961609
MITVPSGDSVGAVTYELAPGIGAHYALGVERDRLATWGRLESERTRELLRRFLPPPPAVVCDVGGAEGAYALPLANGGYTVHLLDAWPPRIEAARAGSVAQPDAPLASAEAGDARELPYRDTSADGVLLFGPLYHLLERVERERALGEAMRVLRPGGVVMAVAISRFASTIDGVRSGAIADPRFEAIVEGDLRDGVHHNPDPVGRPERFTLAYMHDPQEFGEEIRSAGFEDARILAVEGAGVFCDAGPALDDPATREPLLRAIRRVEAEPALLGASPHLMAVAIAP